MDNKPLEELAENYIKTRLAKAGIKYLKPSYDTDGSDLVLLSPINKHYAKQVIVQSKGRNVTNKSSNVSISQQYIVSNFVCFLYLEVETDEADHFYIFFSNSIKKWNCSNGKYVLSIPKAFKNNEYFEKHRFTAKKHIPEINELLSNVPIFRQSYIHFEKMELTEVLFEMWKKYDSFPDLNLVRAIYEDFYSLSGSHAQDIFMVFTIGRYINDLECHTLDHFMQDLYDARNLSRPIAESVQILNPEKIECIYSDWAIVYHHLKFGEVQVDYDGIKYKGLYCYIGDNEDHVEAIVFDNGDYVAFGKRKHF